MVINLKVEKYEFIPHRHSCRMVLARMHGSEPSSNDLYSDVCNDGKHLFHISRSHDFSIAASVSRLYSSSLLLERSSNSIVL